jgi:hypothetical protein
MVQHRLRFIRTLVVWMLLGLAVLSVFDALSFELVFVVSFLGYLVMSEVETPVNRTVTWRRRLWPITVLGTLGFGYILATHLLRALPPGVF